MPPQFVYVLLQFRDLTGLNYAKVYWFFEEEHVEGSRFRLGSMLPHSITTSRRINYNEHLELLYDDASPALIDDGFLEAWKSAIPCGYLKVGYRGVEDRGTWTEI